MHEVHLAPAKIDTITFYQITIFTSFPSSSAMVSIHFFFLDKKTAIRNEIKIRENTDSVSGRLPLTEPLSGKETLRNARNKRAERRKVKKRHPRAKPPLL